MSDRKREDEILQQMGEFIENAYALQYNELRDKLERVLSVLKIYADRGNWTPDAMGNDVWQYSENGYDLAQSTLDELGVK